jgi:hypothetical protein
MKPTFYSLGEYKIIERDNGALWWEAHAGLSAFIGGKCFIRGEILFIGLAESEEPGFLANEFLNQLERFPKWGKTKHYCLNYTIYECRSGRKLAEEEIAAWSRTQTQLTEETDFSRTLLGKGNQEQGSDSTEDASFRLGRYEIIQKPTGQVRWRTPSGHTLLREGKSVIVEDILFIGAAETEEPGNLRRRFLERLGQLPEWKTTQYYSPSYALYDCGTGRSLAKGEGGSWPTAESPRKGEGLSKRNAKLSATFKLPSLKFRKVLRAIHTRADTPAAPTKESIGAEKEKREKGAKNKSGREANADKLDRSNSDTAIQWLGRKKWIGYFVVFLLITSFLLLAVLFGYSKKEEGHHRRDDHPSSHRSDHSR